MLLTRNETFLAEPRVQRAVDVSNNASSLRWTDDYAGLWQALN